MKKLYVGNLSYDVTEEELTDAFCECGKVASVRIIRDKYDNSSKGFGFVEFDSNDEGQKAIDNMDGVEVQGREMRVSEAKEKEGGGRRGGGNRQGGGYQGGSGGGDRRGGSGNRSGGGGDRRGGSGNRSGNSDNRNKRW